MKGYSVVVFFYLIWITRDLTWTKAGHIIYWCKGVFVGGALLRYLVSRFALKWKFFIVLAAKMVFRNKVIIHRWAVKLFWKLFADNLWHNNTISSAHMALMRRGSELNAMTKTLATRVSWVRNDLQRTTNDRERNFYLSSFFCCIEKILFFIPVVGHEFL